MRSRRPDRWALALLALLALAPRRASAQDEGAQDGGPPEDGAPTPQLTPPELLEAPEVQLPEGAEPLPDGVAVILSVTVDAEGSVADVEVLEGARDDVDALVLEAARSMRFRPATRGGTPIPGRIRFQFRVPPTPAPTHGEGADEEDEAHLEAPEEEPASGEPELGVTAVVERPEEGAASRFTLRGEELSTVPGTFGEPLRAVASMPGVSRSPFGLGFFLVRGSDFQNTGFLVDGFPVPLLYHVGAGPAILPTRFVEQMNFYAGNYPVQYGRYSGGLVSLDTAIPTETRPLGEASVDLARASVLTIVPTDDGRGAIAAGFRRSYFELVLPFIQPGLEVSFMDYQVLGRYAVDDHLTVSFFFFGANDLLDQSGQLGDGGLISDGSRSSVAFDLQRLIASVRVRLDSGLRFKLSGMVGRDASGFDTSQPGFGMLNFSFEAFFTGWRLDAELPFSENVRARFGFDINTLSAAILGTAPVPSGLGEQPRPLPSISTSDTSLTVVEAFAAAYWEQVFDFAPLELSAGLRLDVVRYGDVIDVVPDPRAVARVAVHPMLTLKLASGLFMQQPSPFTIFRVGGNPAVPPERSWQTSGGLELRLPFGLEAWVTGFYNRQWQIARGVDEIVPTGDGLRRVFFRPDGEGQAYGLETLLRLRHEGFYGWATYTLSRSERWSPGVEAQTFAFDQTHVLNVVASYGFDGWRFGLRFQLASGRPVRTPTSARLDADTGGYQAIGGPADQRLAYSHQLDLRIDRAFDLGPVQGSVYLDIVNAYFSDLPEGLVYQYDYGRSALLRGLPIIPSIGIRGTLQ